MRLLTACLFVLSVFLFPALADAALSCNAPSASICTEYTTTPVFTCEADSRQTVAACSATNLIGVCVQPSIKYFYYLISGDNYAAASSYATTCRIANGSWTYGTATPFPVLTVAKSGTGSGVVKSSDSNINCGKTCSAAYASATSVTLTAVPDTGSYFYGWGGACTGTGACTVNADAAKSVTATFQTASMVAFISVVKTGTGSGTVTSADGSINCGDTCSANYTGATTVTLAASPASGSMFAGWDGACTGAGTCSLTLDAISSVTAKFLVADAAYSLTISKSGAGTGTVTSSDGNIDCGSICSATYASATNVLLTSAPASGSTFAGWGGACAGAGTCSVTMNAAKDVSATFGKVPFTATTTGVTAGLITAPVATVTAKVVFNSADVGKPESVFITAWAPLNTLNPAQRARIADYTLLRVYAQTTTTSFALVQLTSSGWQPVVNGQLIPYVSGVLSDQSAAISILDNTDTSKLLGSQFCVGYGTSAAEMTAAGRMQLIATIPGQGTAKSSSGSCNVALPISDARVFAYAEANYASLFAGAVTSGLFQQYDYRYYADTRNYLAVDTSGVIFILGPVSNDVVTSVAPVESFRDVITTWEGTP